MKYLYIAPKFITVAKSFTEEDIDNSRQEEHIKCILKDMKKFIEKEAKLISINGFNGRANELFDIEQLCKEYGDRDDDTVICVPSPGKNPTSFYGDITGMLESIGFVTSKYQLPDQSQTVMIYSNKMGKILTESEEGELAMKQEDINKINNENRRYQKISNGKTSQWVLTDEEKVIYALNDIEKDEDYAGVVYCDAPDTPSCKLSFNKVTVQELHDMIKGKGKKHYCCLKCGKPMRFAMRPDAFQKLARFDKESRKDINPLTGEVFYHQ
ncbi:MAG: hypothetical protein HFH68_14485 [Lachnospiraceae bacterium]|nr:hypothetical protein [Lachnospiraceae bacterium]